MPIYNISGNIVTTPYTYGGNTLSQVYNVNGNAIMFVVMSYNVMWFKDINSQQDMQNEIIAKYHPDIIGMQELRNYSTLPTVGAVMLAGYQYKQFSNHDNKDLFVSKSLPLSNFSTADFTNQDPEDMTQYGETRSYMKADIVVNGKTITWFNAHLCFLTRSVKWQQMSELFTMAQNCEYAILTGDFNSYPMTVDSEEYTGMYKPFVDAGYKVLNCSPAYGFQNTYTSASNPNSLADLTHPHDSIIVSSNITVTDVVFDTTKFNYKMPSKQFDHIPMVAYLQI